MSSFKKYINENLIPVFNAVVLTPESKRKLSGVFPGIHSKKFIHHVTLQFRPDDFPADLGQEVEIHVTGYASDENADAVSVTLNGTTSTNEFPHITISTTSDTKPVYSNELLERSKQNGTLQNLKRPIILKGVVSSFIPKYGYITKIPNEL